MRLCASSRLTRPSPMPATPLCPTSCPVLDCPVRPGYRSDDPTCPSSVLMLRRLGLDVHFIPNLVDDGALIEDMSLALIRKELSPSRIRAVVGDLFDMLVAAA